MPPLLDILCSVLKYIYVSTYIYFMIDKISVFSKQVWNYIYISWLNWLISTIIFCHSFTVESPCYTTALI